MSDRFHVSAVGAVIEIDLSLLDDSDKARVHDVWADAMLVSHRAPAAVVQPQPQGDEEKMLSVLSTDVTRAAVRHQAGRLWMLRGATAFADARGHVIAVLSSGEEDGSAARELYARYSCISDAIVGIDASGRVETYFKPASLSDPVSGETHSVRPSRLDGSSNVPAGLRLSKVIIHDRGSSATSASEAEQLDMAEALSLLAPRSEALDRTRGALRAAESVLRATGGAVRIHGGETSVVTTMIDRLFDEQPTDAKRAQPPSVRDVPVDAAGKGHVPGPFRGPVLDALELDHGRIALLARGPAGAEVRVLQAVEARLWAEADGGHGGSGFDAGQGSAGQHEAVRGEAERHALLEEGLLAHEPSWRVSDGTSWTTSTVRSFVFNPASNTSGPIALEGSANAIWSILTRYLSLAQSELIDECARLFEIEPSRIESDVTGLLEQLRRADVVEII